MDIKIYMELVARQIGKAQENGDKREAARVLRVGASAMVEAAEKLEAEIAGGK